MGMMFSLSHPLSASPLLAQKRNNTPIIMPYKAKPKPLYNYKFKLCALLCSLKHSPFSLSFCFGVWRGTIVSIDRKKAGTSNSDRLSVKRSGQFCP
jgi:hypothetical protein